jgi:GT2 family glycosyltransferase
VIPAFVATAYNRHDLLLRMLKSIDEPVGRGLIIDNGLTDLELPEFLGPEWKVLQPPFSSLGYPGSINFIIGQTPDAPWWFWASNDIVFGPGDLAQIAAFMDEAGGTPRVVTSDYSWGAINRATIDRIGLFDEWSFYPIYYDDTDFGRRVFLGGVEWIRYEGGITQGADGFANSLTINSDPAMKSKNGRSWPVNEAAFVAKWGGLPGHEVYETPWNSGLPLWVTRPDPRGRQIRSW